jgi:Zn-finger nucleic acid-binding protein
MTSPHRCQQCGAVAASTDRICGHCKAELLTARCPGCFALHPAEAAHCSRCGATLGAVQRLGSLELRCPRCADARLRGLALPGGDERGDDVGECIGCGGLFVAHAVLDRATREADARRGVSLQSAVAPAGEAERSAYVRCPQCQHWMHRTNFARVSGVVIDVCHAHGVWFDHDELPRVLAFVEEHGRPKDDRRLLRALDRGASTKPAPELDSHSDVGSFTRDLVADLLRTLVDPRRWWP